MVCCVHLCWELSSSAMHCRDYHFVYACICMLSGIPASSADTPKSAVERAPSQVVEAMRALELELAEAREAKERLKEHMRGLKEELERK